MAIINFLDTLIAGGIIAMGEVAVCVILSGENEGNPYIKEIKKRKRRWTL